MYPDPNPDNKKVDPQEKDKRQFTVLLVFIVIIGSSLIAGIIKFRQAKKEVKELTQGQSLQDQVPGLRPGSTSSTKEGDLPATNDRRRPQQSDQNGQQAQQKEDLVKKRLIPEVRDREPQKRSVRNLVGELSRLDLAKRYFKKGKQSFVEVKNMVAVPLEYKDRYSADEIIGERHNKVLIRLPKGEPAPQESMGIALNTRTKRLAIITGTLKVRFKDNFSFDKRQELIPASQREKNSFQGIQLSLLEVLGSASLDDLQREQDYWATQPGVKSAEVELLEAEITTN